MQSSRPALRLLSKRASPKEGLVVVVLVTVAVVLGVTLSDKDNKAAPLTWSPLSSELLEVEEDGGASYFVFQNFDVSRDGKFLVIADVSVPDYTFQNYQDLNDLLTTPPDYTTRVRLFASMADINDDSWTLQATLSVDDGHPLTSPVVRLADDLIVLADAEGSGEDDSRGAVRFYRIDGGELALVDELLAEDSWGSAISINDDGDRVAIGRSLAQHPEGAVQVHQLLASEEDKNIVTAEPLGSALYDEDYKQDLAGFGVSLGSVSLSVTAILLPREFLFIRSLVPLPDKLASGVSIVKSMTGKKRLYSQESPAKASARMSALRRMVPSWLLLPC